jgi:hypothetical protein
VARECAGEMLVPGNECASCCMSCRSSRIWVVPLGQGGCLLSPSRKQSGRPLLLLTPAPRALLQPTHGYIMPTYARGSVTKTLRDICNQ